MNGDSVVYAIGILCGMLFVFMLEFVWIGLGSSVREWLWENTLDALYRRKHGIEQQPAPPEEGPISILFSDIHIDTWDLDPTRYQTFSDFLQWVSNNPRVNEVYINGDILDAPPNPVNQRDVTTLTIDCDPTQDPYPDLNEGPLGVLQAAYEPTLQELATIAKPITYVTGNHDIGIEGVRYICPTLKWSAFRVAWNPSILLKSSKDRWVYFEHGHRYDPFLWLYLRYAILQLFRGPSAVRTSHHQAKVGMKKLLSPHELQSAKSAILPWEHEGDIHHDCRDGIGAWVARYRYREAARRAFRRIQKEQGTEVKVVTFGHTHLPDRYTFPRGRVYINSGDWAGGSPDQSYLIIHSNGVVEGPIQWR